MSERIVDYVAAYLQDYHPNADDYDPEEFLVDAVQFVDFMASRGITLVRDPAFGPS